MKPVFDVIQTLPKPPIQIINLISLKILKFTNPMKELRKNSALKVRNSDSHSFDVKERSKHIRYPLRYESPL